MKIRKWNVIRFKVVKMKTYLFKKATKICNNEKFLIEINVSS